VPWLVQFKGTKGYNSDIDGTFQINAASGDDSGGEFLLDITPQEITIARGQQF